ncbi:MAG: POTRA domain-containing protein [Alistipes indistinctus]
MTFMSANRGSAVSAYPRLTGPLGAAFDTLQASSLIRPGAQYNMDTLSAERQRISNILRNAGYYFFRPDYIDYKGRHDTAPRTGTAAHAGQADRSGSGITTVHDR